MVPRLQRLVQRDIGRNDEEHKQLKPQKAVLIVPPLSSAEL
jgi:hypothetical protein